MNLRDLSNVGNELRDEIENINIQLDELRENLKHTQTGLIEATVIDAVTPQLCYIKESHQRVDICSNEDCTWPEGNVRIEDYWDDDQESGRRYEIRWTMSSDNGNIKQDFSNVDMYADRVKTMHAVVAQMSVVRDEWEKITNEYYATVSELYDQKRELRNELNAIVEAISNLNNDKILTAAKEGITMNNGENRNCWCYYKNDNRTLHINTWKLIKESPKSLLIEFTHTWKPYDKDEPISQTVEERVNKDDFLHEVYVNLV